MTPMLNSYLKVLVPVAAVAVVLDEACSTAGTGRSGMPEGTNSGIFDIFVTADVVVVAVVVVASVVVVVAAAGIATIGEATTGALVVVVCTTVSDACICSMIFDGACDTAVGSTTPSGITYYKCMHILGTECLASITGK